MWISFTKERVQARMSPIESSALTGFDSADQAAGVDVLQEIIDAVTAEMRAAIQMCSKNTLDPDTTTIPLSCLNDALALVVYYVASRAGLVVADDPRYNAWLKARENLDKLRSCEILPENPETGVTAHSGDRADAQIVVEEPPRFTRAKFRAL